MKKVVMLVSAVVLCAGLTFGQTPQKKETTTKPAAKTEAPAKDAKAGCDAKTKAACPEAKKGSSCCAGHDAKKGCSDMKAPEKK